MFKSIRVAAAKQPLTVAAVFKGDKRPAPSLGLSAEQRALVEAALQWPGDEPGAGNVRLIDADLAIVSLGDKEELDGDAVRRAGGRLIRQLDAIAPKSVHLRVGSLLPKRHRLDWSRALGEGIGLANWRVDFFDGSATKRPAARDVLTIEVDPKDVAGGVRQGLGLADSVNEARRIAATPPNLCHPTWMASEARKLAKKAGLTCRVISGAEAAKLGMGGLVAVGQASAHKPCLIILEHKPARARTGQHVALVGKTMTYDTGGYSLKPTAGMKGMKYDGNGGCAVLGAMLAIAHAKLPVRVTALLPCAENMISGEGYRPDDIITMYNGVKVEVTNTDAEGRLILADALAYACDKLAPTAIVDVATLTGGVVVALGSWCAGLFCNDDTLLDEIEDAAEATGEKVWQLPLWEAHRDFMRSRHADLWNSGPKRDGHPIQGAAFLSFFVDPEIPWAHLDIAGVSAVDADDDLHVTGPTGFGVRLLTNYVESLTA